MPSWAFIFFPGRLLAARDRTWFDFAGILLKFRFFPAAKCPFFFAALGVGMAVYVPHQVRQGGTLCKWHFGACFFSSAFRSCFAPALHAPCRVVWGFSGWSSISVFPRAPARSGSVAVTGISPCFAGFREWLLLRTAGVLRLSCRASLHFSLFVACMFDCSSARLKPGQPSFSGGFRVFWIATRKCVCVCVKV